MSIEMAGIVGSICLVIAGMALWLVSWKARIERCIEYHRFENRNSIEGLQTKIAVLYQRPFTRHCKCELCGELGHKQDMVELSYVDWQCLRGDKYIVNAEGLIHFHKPCMNQHYAPKLGQVGWKRKPEKKGKA